MSGETPTIAPSPPDPRPLRELFRGWQWVVVAFVSSRLLICAIMVLSRMVFKPSQYWQSGRLLSVFIQWDASLWYLDIVRKGYTYSLVERTPMPFFPFYPLLVKGVSFIFHDVRIAGVLVANACFIGAGLLFNALLNLDYADARVNRTAAVFLMFSPYSFFFSCAYTESTFLVLAIGSLLAARRGHWVLACVLGMFLSGTRQVGLLIGLPLFIEYVLQHWRRGGSIWGVFHPRLLLFGLVPLGLGGYMLFSYIKFGDALAFANVSKHAFERGFASPLVTLATVELYSAFYDWLFIGVLVTSVLLLIGGIFLKVRVSYLAYAGLLTTTYLCSSSLEALPRYLSVEFVLFLVLGVVSTRFKWTYEPLLVATIGLLTLCTILFATGFWIT
ncbi:MAG: hypothetical protein ABR589_00145 [Chthoniobacterales bacterium]